MPFEVREAFAVQEGDPDLYDQEIEDAVWEFHQQLKGLDDA